MPYRQHLNAAADLITPRAVTRAGFVAQVVERNLHATPFVQQALDLRESALRAADARALLDMADVQAGLLTAAGVSDKAKGYMEADDRRAAMVSLVEKFLVPAGDNFVAELIARFLLTRGDTLGGIMRNKTGTLAQQRLTTALLARLRNIDVPFRWLNDDKRWRDAPEDDAVAALTLCGLHWMRGDRPRTLLYNRKVPLVGKNVDLCLFQLLPAEITPATKEDAKSYVALGELKGGNDPAGADEHWKTALTALDRVRSPFAAINVAVEIFFVGGAIVPEMAGVLWGMLQAGTIRNAANLTNDHQLTSIVRWLTDL